MTIVALIPARAGSKRIPGKNTRLLAGHPLIAYTIAAAQQSGIFGKIFCSTDSVDIGQTAAAYGAIHLARDPKFATDESPDIEWVRAALWTWAAGFDAFAILRPTSPFRTAATIQRAWTEFQALPAYVDSLRAVELWRGPSPYKMWHVHEDRMVPILRAESVERVPQHSCPTQTLPPVYVQNASLEIARTAVVKDTNTISGFQVAPFFTHDFEGVNLDTEADWDHAEAIITECLVTGFKPLPPIETSCPR